MNAPLRLSGVLANALDSEPLIPVEDGNVEMASPSPRPRFRRVRS